MTAMLEAALAYAASGYPVFPVRRDKRPHTEHGFHDATIDTDIIRDWWTKWPDDGIGIPTGAVSGIVVVDIDPRNGGDKSLADVIAEFGQLPPGPEVRTGGGGRHLWFQHPGGAASVVHGFRPGLDFQGDGAYVIVPPSPHASGNRYEWVGGTEARPLPFLTAWLFRIIYERAPVPFGARAPPSYPAPKSDQEALQRVYSGPNGDLHRWVYEERLGKVHCKDHPAYVAFCTALYFAGATEDQVPRILGFTPESWASSGRYQWRHLCNHGGYYRRRDTLTRVSWLYRDALAALNLPAPESAGAPMEVDPPPPPSVVSPELCVAWAAESPAPGYSGPDLWITRRGQELANPAGFVSAILALPGRRFVTRTDNDELLLYHNTGEWKGMYNGHAHAFVGAWTEARFVSKMGTASKKFHSEMEGSIRRRTYTDPTRFNPPGKICLLSGVLDLDAKVLDEHTPNLVFTWKMPVRYDPEAKCPRFDAFLREVMPDERKAELLVDLIGYCLWRENPFQNFFVIVGDGANGKTRFINVIEDLLGPEAVSTESLQTISTQRFGPAQLEGRLANICDDLPHNQTLSGTGILKTLTGGGTIRAERKGKDPFKFRFGGKLINTANRLPEVDDDTYAFRRRPITIVFRETIPEEQRDPTLRDVLKDELPGILNRALEGYARVRQRATEKRGFDPDGLFVDGEEEWARRSDQVREFLDSTRDLGMEYETDTKELYDDYKEWCARENRKPLNDISFGRRMSRALPLSRVEQRKAGKRRWNVRVGVGVKRAGLGIPESASPAHTLDGTSPPKSGNPQAGDPTVAGKGSGLGMPWDGCTGASSAKQGSGVSEGIPRPPKAGGVPEAPPAPPSPGAPESDSRTSDNAFPTVSEKRSGPARSRHQNCDLCRDLEWHNCIACDACEREQRYRDEERAA
jgi:putative DNA primase/helicase